MTFKIISCGWQCAPFIEQTLHSVEMQNRSDWEMLITYEGTEDNGSYVIQKWIEDHNDDPRWNYVFNPHSLGSDSRARWETIHRSNPDDDDIIIFLDLDGDELAHPDVLEHLDRYYLDGTLTTYGNYMPKPHHPGCLPVQPYPPHVVATRSYRTYGGLLFNHLRTMKAKVWRAIPLDQFQGRDGYWYPKGCDVQFTLCALELAGPRIKVIDEVLIYYNTANPLSAWRICGDETNAATHDFMSRPALPILEEIS